MKDGQRTKNDLTVKKRNQLENSLCGNGLHQVGNHQIYNKYLLQPPAFWTGEDFIKATQLRFNLLPCKGLPYNPLAERRCRAGCFKVESVSHILQNCPLTHLPRTQRHDSIVHKDDSYACARGWTVNVEMHVRGEDGILRKPDLVMNKDNEVIISDVGINWKGPIALSTQYHNKSAIYSQERFFSSFQLQTNVMANVIFQYFLDKNTKRKEKPRNKRKIYHPKKKFFRGNSKKFREEVALKRGPLRTIFFLDRKRKYFVKKIGKGNYKISLKTFNGVYVGYGPKIIQAKIKAAEAAIYTTTGLQFRRDMERMNNSEENEERNEDNSEEYEDNSEEYEENEESGRHEKIE